MIQSWIDQRNELCDLIKKISDGYGGDDKDWLMSYVRDIIEKNKNDLEVPLMCFRELAEQLKYYPDKTPERPSPKTNICNVCGYVPPFCRFDLDGKCHNKKASDGSSLSASYVVID